MTQGDTRTVKLSEVVEAFECAAGIEDGAAFLNRKTGETWWDSPLFEDAIEEEEPGKLDEIEESPDWVALPDSFDFHEYRHMERFCAAQQDPVRRDRLLRAIRGSGAFGRFKVLAEEYGLLEEWFRTRDEAQERMLIDWLEAEGIAFARE